MDCRLLDDILRFVGSDKSCTFVMCSMVFNYLLAVQIRNCIKQEYRREKLANVLLALGVVANLCFLGYFKYKNFFADNLNEVFGLSLEITKVVLPLGISFITFQKIGFLIDVRSKIVKDFSLDNYFVFVFFFPQLIAGPIVHYREMMPQFDRFSLRLSSDKFCYWYLSFFAGIIQKSHFGGWSRIICVPWIFSSSPRGASGTFCRLDERACFYISSLF